MVGAHVCLPCFAEREHFYPKLIISCISLKNPLFFEIPNEIVMLIIDKDMQEQQLSDVDRGVQYCKVSQ